MHTLKKINKVNKTLKLKKHSNLCNNNIVPVSNTIKYLNKLSFKNPTKNVYYFIKNFLKKYDVKGAVGMPGTASLYFYDQINNDSNFSNNLIKNEMNAGFITNGSFRSSRYKKRNFIISYATTGPGTTNLCTPIADALADNIPCIYVVNDQASYNKIRPYYSDRNRFPQDLDTNNILEKISKCIVRISDLNTKNGKFIDDLFIGLLKAFSYPQGPLIITFESSISQIYFNEELRLLCKEKIKSLPFIFESNIGLNLDKKFIINAPDYMTGFLVEDEYKLMKNHFFRNNKKKIVIQNMFDFLNETLYNKTRPLLIIGNGCISFIDDLYEWIHTFKIPYLTSLPLQGYVNKDDPICAVRMGHTATYCGNMAAYNADWILCIGISFNKYQMPSDDVSKLFSQAKNIISINLYPELVTVPYITDYIITDGKNILKWIPNINDYSEWLLKFKEWKYKGDEKIKEIYYKNSNILQYGTIYNTIQTICDEFIDKNTNRNVWITTDTGINQLLTASLFQFKNIKNYKFITSGKYAPVGCGLGTALGIANTNPNDLVILFCGDTGFQLSMSDLITIKEMNIKNLAIFIFENSGIGLVEQEDIELGLNRLPYANGYKETIDWKKLIDSSLQSTYIWNNNSEHQSHNIKDKIKNCLFNINSFICVCVVEYDIYYSPSVNMNECIIDMNYYYPDKKNKKFNEERCKLIKN